MGAAGRLARKKLQPTPGVRASKPAVTLRLSVEYINMRLGVGFWRNKMFDNMCVGVKRIAGRCPYKSWPLNVSLDENPLFSRATLEFGALQIGEMGRAESGLNEST